MNINPCNLSMSLHVILLVCLQSLAAVYCIMCCETNSCLEDQRSKVVYC